MKNLDLLKEEKTKIQQRLMAAMKDGNEADFQQAFTDFTEMLERAVTAEAKGLIESNDQRILSTRGVRALTSEETTYYQSVIDAMKSSNPQQALTDLDVVLPKTIIDSIFDDMTEAHPILNHINFQNTGALIEILLSTTSGTVAWGELTAAIAAELAGDFEKVDLAQKKVSAFVPVAKSMLDLGPAWLDRYVRALLSEALATGLEAAIVDGDGNAKPLGMTRALTGATDGVYPRKAATAITALDPTTLGTILNSVSQGPNSKRRNVPRLLMVVNPSDYYTKVYPAITPRTADGMFAQNALPYPIDVVVSAAVPENRAVFGLASRYFMGIGTSKGGKLLYSDEYKFLEDNRVYLIKLYGNGKPLDANAFYLADITNLTPTVLNVNVTNADDFPVA